MNTKGESTSEPKKKSIWKKTGIIAGGIVILIIILILLVPFYVSSKSGTNMIIGKINSSIDGKVQVSELSMGWLSGIKLTNVKFNDTAGAMEFTAKAVSTDPVYTSMLGGQIDLGKTIVDTPVVHVDLAKLKGETVTPAKEQPSQQRVEKPEPKAQGPAKLPVRSMDFALNDGSVTVTDSSGKRPAVQLAGINTLLSLRPIGQQTTFKINLVAANNPISATGNITPSEENGWALVGTSGDLNIDIDKLNLASLESVMAIVDPNIVASGIITAKGNVKLSDGQFENIQLRVNGSNIKVKLPALKGDTFATTKLIANINAAAAAETFTIQTCDIQADWANANLKGVLPKSFKNFGDLMSPQSPALIQGSADLDIARLASQLPNTLGLKKGTTISSGDVKALINTETSAQGKVITANVNLASLQGVVNGKKAAISQPITIDAQVAAGKAGAIQINQLKASSSFANANVSGTMEAIKYALDCDLAKMQNELGQFVDFAGYKFVGKLNAAGNVGIADNILTSNGQADIGQLTVTNAKGASASEQSAKLKYDIKLDQKTNVLTIPAFSAVTSFANIEVNNAVLPLNEKTDESASMLINAKTDLAKAMPWMTAFGGLQSGTQFGGVFNSKVNITSKGTEYHIVTEDTKISNLSVISAGKSPFTQSQIAIVADVYVDGVAKTYRIKDMKITSPSINITLTKFSQTSDKDTSKLQGTINAQYDLVAVSAMASPFMPSGLAVTGSRKDTITFSSQWPTSKPDQMMANMDASLGFGWQSAAYQGLNFGPTEMKVTIKKGAMTLAPFTSTVNNGTLSFAANADFKQKPTLLKTPQEMQVLKDVQVTIDLAMNMLKFLNPVFGGASQAKGTAQLTCQTLAIPIQGGTNKDMEIVAQVAMQNLQVESGLMAQVIKFIKPSGATMTLQPTTFVLRNGLLSYEKMQLDIGDMPIIFQGQIDITTNQIKSMTMSFPVSYGGRKMNLTAAVTGSVDHPKVDLAKVIQSNIGNILGGVLGGQTQSGSTGSQSGTGTGTTNQPSSTEDAGRKLLEQGLQNILGGKKK